MVEPESTTKHGDRFRDQVAALLKSTGHEVITEVLVYHKRVDVIFEQYVFGRLKRYILEAKNWNRPLNKSDLEEILASHLSLVRNREFEELLVVSPHPLSSPAAKAFVRDTPEINHLSFFEFQESVLGFRDYLLAFIAQHEGTGLENYFIEPSTLEYGSLLKHIDNWVEQLDQSPIAIIAGYGMGKTSLAEHLTYNYAKSYLEGEPTRIPVMIRLGSLSREQSLSGLLGTVLAGESPAVRNYNFPTFLKLNEMGRFLIVLDGFDEMKHMMSWSDFRNNFDELNKLNLGKSKVILLGRPSVFLSDDEKSYVLKGERRFGSIKSKRSNAPKYCELSIAPFSHDQVREFVKNYITSSGEKSESIPSELLSRRLLEVDLLKEDGLLSRPVHTKMFAELSTDVNIDLSAVSRFSLYDYFIDHLIDRELSKPGRGIVHKTEDRRQFSCDLAWFLWIEQRRSGKGCRLADLPDEIFEPYVPQGEDTDTTKRDLISGSFLEEKSGGIFYFSHRSFQEFLVAEHIWNTCGVGGGSGMGSYASSLEFGLTHDVMSFLDERKDPGFCRNLLKVMESSLIDLSEELYSVVLASPLLQEIISREPNLTYSYMEAFCEVFAYSRFKEANSPKQIESLIEGIKRKTSQKPRVMLQALFAMAVYLTRDGQSVDWWIRYFIAGLFYRAASDIPEMAVLKRRRDSADDIQDLIFSCVTSEIDPKTNELMITLHLGEFVIEAQKFHRIPVDMPYDEPGESEVKLSFKDFFRETSRADLGTLESFYRLEAETMAQTSQTNQSRT